MTSPKPILITGATGNQGGALIQALLSSPQASSFLLLAVTRNPSSPSAQKLAAQGVRLVKGDLNDIPALFAAAKAAAGADLWGVFSVQVSVGPGASPEKELAQGKGLVDAALAGSVDLFVYASVDRGGEEKSWDTPTGVGHFVTKYHIERHLRDAAGEKMRWTVLRPTAFMDNWNPGFFGRLFSTIWRTVLKDTKLQLIAAKDIGVFASLAFLDPDKYNHRAISLAGDEISFAEATEVVKTQTGRPLDQSWEITAKGALTMLPEVRTMFDWFVTDGYKADINNLKSLHPGLLSWSDWVAKESSHEQKK